MYSDINYDEIHSKCIHVGLLYVGRQGPENDYLLFTCTYTCTQT